MKKIIVIILFAFLFFETTFSADSIFIKIPDVKTVIGSNEFKYKKLGSEDVYYEIREHKVELSAFEISKYLITNSEYYNFRKKTHYKTTYEKNYNTQGDVVFNNQIRQNNPVAKISAFDAIAFCQWYSDTHNGIYRLPTNAEWEYVATGGKKLKFPWGNDNKVLQSTGTNDILPRENFTVTEIVEDISPLGICNILGGEETVLDHYKYMDEHYSDKLQRNPLIFYSGAVELLRRGTEEYNELSDNMGLFGFSYANFKNSWNRGAFRLVKDYGTVFNIGEVDECIYFIARGTSITDKISVYEMPTLSCKEVYSIQSTDLFILYKTVRSSENFYRAYFKNGLIAEKFDNWESGWVKVDDVKLVEKKWYDSSY